ncbi:Tigger transposable element-derived protein 1 [Chionoecetes opilio]|uniref:Tigger transposable element-derived protein 1 n=1 Tax=Chionoecetes opilio TaxID=41210 RepID=A0A8J4YEY8_CHIOP|nr:Tigger transposable element-derived protein 1 [Chionoecetes opilio]
MRPLFVPSGRPVKKIRQSVRESADVSSKVASVSRHDPLLEKMEKILNRWISEQVDQRKSNVDGVAIREKARSIYDHLAEKEPSGSSPAPGFIASHGWFHRFKQRFSLHNMLAQLLFIPPQPYHHATNTATTPPPPQSEVRLKPPSFLV